MFIGDESRLKFKWGFDSLKGRSILVQGVGHVGENLVRYVAKKVPRSSLQI